MSAILAFLTPLLPVLLKVAATTAGGSIVVWLLGHLSNSLVGEALLAKAGRQAYRIGVATSDFGTGRLGPLWNPLEAFGTKWVRFLLDQYFAGLRADNPEKLQDELARLEAVGSETRAKGIAEKLATLAATPRPVRDADDAAIAFQATFDGNQSIKDKLAE